MSLRFAILALACTALATPALAQDAPDTAGEGTPLPAERVIPNRQSAPIPIFVSNPVIQGVTAVDPLENGPTAALVPPSPIATPARASTPYLPPMGTTPVYYAIPLQQAGAVGTAQPSATPPMTYAATAPLPAGSQLVTFDSASWLAACRDRLASYDDEDARVAAIGALGGAAAGASPDRDHCAAYLDSYMASATAGTLAVQPQYGQQYMLVPMTVLVPQMPAR